MNIGIDIDGTINNFTTLIYKHAELYNETQGIKSKADLSDYSLQRCFGWSSYQDNEFWSRHLKTAMAYCIPLPGAVQAISRLKGEGMGIYIITARMNKYRELTNEWLEKHKISYDVLVMSKEKADQCLRNRIDIMIDDMPDNCLSIAQHTPVLCMGYPYNRNLNGIKNIKIISSWAEAYSEIIDLYKQRQVS